MLKNIFNACFSLGYFPNALKKAIIKFIPKDNKSPKHPVKDTLLPALLAVYALPALLSVYAFAGLVSCLRPAGLVSCLRFCRPC